MTPRLVLWLLALAWAATRSAIAQTIPEPVSFARDIRPILSDRCFACHGPDGEHRQADLRLDDEESSKRDRDGHRVVHAGDAQASELLLRVTSADPNLKMPPTDSGKSLSDAETALLRRWIDEGATWGQHWAYERPMSRPLPEVDPRTKDWAETWIDRHLLAKMQAARLQPGVDAEARALARRLALDLTGLPPDPQRLEAFEAAWRSTDSTTDAGLRPGSSRGQLVRQLVDQLLASPHFGERLGEYWLDLVRYADTVGYHGDQEHSISPYRDYVIQAMNDDLPFDQFTRQQLAGDLLPGDDPDRHIASAYNRLLQTSHEGGVQPKEYIAIYAADRVRNVSLVWMGATLGCAQCHDHKFDPFTTRDFYAMAAYFADIDDERHLGSGTNSDVTKREPEIATMSRVERERLAKLGRHLEDARRRLESTTEASEREALEQQIARWDARQRIWQQQARLCMVTQSLETPRTVRILPRGNWLDESGPIVPPAPPSFLEMDPSSALPPDASPEASAAQRAANADASLPRASRLDLANWLVDDQRGVGQLTARVMVNRLWYLLFGAGLSRSLDDFGGQGQPPEHPELLDQLAREFTRSGWDLKHMLRLMATSHAYRLVSEETPEQRSIDPQNRWLTHQNRYRLPAETVRDISLAVSGLLVREVGGPSAKPYQPDGYYRHLNFPERTYKHDATAQQWRRGVYVHWQRTYLHPTLKSLDAPTREECTAERARSNTPLAALALLNDPSFVEAARVLAARLLEESPGATDEQQLHNGFLRVLSRPPDSVERDELLALLADERNYYTHHSEEATRLLAIGQYSAPPLVGQDASTAVAPSEVAAWTSVARALLNLHETITRH